MKQRSHAFDLLCGICIIRMITLHITEICSFTGLEWWQNIMQWTYYFMSLFFFKAGYFNKSVAGNTKEFLIDKAKRLLIPYCSWGVIGGMVYFFFVLFVFPSNHYAVRELTSEHLWSSSATYGNIPLWFLFSFFMTYVIAHLISKIHDFPAIQAKGYALHARVIWVTILFPYLSYWFYTEGNQLPMNLENVFFGVFLFELGRLWRVVVDKLDKKIMIPVSLFLIAVFVVINVTVGGEYVMSYNIWNGDFFALLTAMICILCGLSGLLLSIKLPRIPIIGYIGEHSMVYFVSHYVIITFYRFVRSANVHVVRHNWDDYIILMFMCFVICTLLVPVVERIPILSGRFSKKPGKLWII